MSSQYEIKIKNKKIYDFYIANKNINFEHMNLVFIEILEKLMTDMDTTLNHNFASKLLDKYTLMDKKIDNIENNMSRHQSDLVNTMVLKLTEYKKDYMGDVRLILSANNNDKLIPLIKEANNHLLDKTTILLKDIIPKSNDGLLKDTNSQLSKFQVSVISETNKLLSTSLDKSTINSFITTINNSFTQSQQALTVLISSSETRMNNRFIETDRNLNEIRGVTMSNSETQNKINTNMIDILKKFENVSSKGNISEHILYNILLALYPCATIEHIGNELKESGDIILIRNRKPKLLIENKDHESKNVTKGEVDKFIRDCEIQECSGIMFAQHRGICNKEHFEIQIHRDNVLLYVHNVGFDQCIIKTAIELVEQFKHRLDTFTMNNGVHVPTGHMIDQPTLENINSEIILYANQKINMLKLLKEFNERMSTTINELKTPILDKFLSSKFAKSSIQSDNICKYCDTYIPKSVKQHMRYCTAKRAYETTNGNSEDDDTDDLHIETDIVISPPIVKHSKKIKSK
jgi:hypothetical protein